MERINRNDHLDLFKTISIFSVIIIHSKLFANQLTNEPTMATAFVNQACRFAVPYFFIVSGYFLTNKLKQKNYQFSDLLNRLKPLGLIFLIWSAIYIILPLNVQSLIEHGYIKTTYWKCYVIIESPIKILFSGTQSQLWFIPALICSQIFVFGIYRYKKNIILPIAFILFVLGVLGGAYQTTSIGIHLPFDTRNGICFASIFIVLGILLKQAQVNVSMTKALLITLAGFVGQLIESSYLYRYYDVPPTSIDFVFSTLPFGLGVMLLALSPTAFSQRYLSRLGQHTLGIYLIHMVFVILLRPLSHSMHPWLYALTMPLTVYLGSILLVILFNKYKNILSFSS